MKRTRLTPVLGFMMVLIAALGSGAAQAEQQRSDAAAAPLTKKAIFFASDGMRPDLMEKYAGQGTCRRTPT